MLGAEDAVTFPTYKEGEVSFPSDISLPPVFSSNGNYGLVASGDTLYHMELRHGRIHGKTPIAGEITAFETGSGSKIFAVYSNQLVSIEGFSVNKSVELVSEAEMITVCGNDPVVLSEDGSLSLFNSDLSLIGNHVPDSSKITCIQGFSDLVVLGYENGTVVSLAVPSFDIIASEKMNGSLIFLNKAGDDLLFSTEIWNEVAVCDPADLIIQVMFTFPEIPVYAASDSSLSCIYAVCPSTGIHVCMENGEIAWSTDEFGYSPLVSLSKDCETALVVWENKVALLLK